MNLKIANSCGSCIHANRPKRPEGHAAHYEVAKTERWCFKHNCHITRETVCDDHEGTTKAAKTAFTRILNFNKRISAVKNLVELMGDKRIKTGSMTYFVKDNWLWYQYDSIKGSEYKLSTKTASHDRDMSEILKNL